ncbi:MAG: bifunctional riboflavin kinase/FAD synthetase [Deferrisomatales bacterium]|nr:bifunctional riboflavin kinase/FAD synthetase [Deferrisomatales bacterium]
MHIIEHSQLVPGQFGRSVVTVGNFDGVHLGHQVLLRRVVERARGKRASSVVYTFHPHPLRVLNPAFCPPLLTAFEDRAARIAAQGLDVLVWARFDRDYAAREPEEFARETLAGSLGTRELWVGPDFAFGRERRGSLGLLRELGKELGFTVEVLPAFGLGGEVVSSTRIRQAVAEADFETAERLLGHPYTLHGPVVRGAGRGRGLGFPTANVLVREECLPPHGVYAAWATEPGGGASPRPAALNIGHNPTFGGAETTVEAYLLDFGGDLYGEELELRPVTALRGEIAFRTPADLSRQICKDVEETRRVLGLRDLTASGGS